MWNLVNTEVACEEIAGDGDAVFEGVMKLDKVRTDDVWNRLKQEVMEITEEKQSMESNDRWYGRCKTGEASVQWWGVLVEGSEKTTKRWTYNLN